MSATFTTPSDAAARVAASASAPSISLGAPIAVFTFAQLNATAVDICAAKRERKRLEELRLAQLADERRRQEEQARLREQQAADATFQLDVQQAMFKAAAGEEIPRVFLPRAVSPACFNAFMSNAELVEVLCVYGQCFSPSRNGALCGRKFDLDATKARRCTTCRFKCIECAGVLGDPQISDYCYLCRSKPLSSPTPH